ncbi:MAG: para-aminobenzoate synthase, subunit I [Bacteroidetes bacterium]|nr:para-aminobenzoate synthase, subunit I [Bacteroidota bacterium]
MWVQDDGLFSNRFIRFAESSPDSVLLETTKADRHNSTSYFFCNPVATIQCVSLDSAEAGLAEIERVCKSGMYAAGFMTYELGYAFEPSLTPPSNLPRPLFWFGVYEKPVMYDQRTHKFNQKFPFTAPYPDPIGETRVGLPTGSLTEAEYLRSVEKIKRYIIEGDTYQVNYTFKLKFGFSGSTGDLYCRLRNAQRVGYSAFIQSKSSSVLSFSPELFFDLKGNSMKLKPMKGTAQRGTTSEDAKQAEFLRTSPKNRAENLMIVDLLRNDIGKISQHGSVRVTKSFEVEKYETVYQATSTIHARLRPRTTIPDLVKALFPSGSVTGAPKIRTMQIIQRLEKEPRGIYTGAIGFFGPKRRAVFNVAIRTVVVDHRQKKAEMGVGSGIVHDSDPRDEYRECLLKANFLTEPVHDFELLETIRWDLKTGWFLLKEHLARFKDSAEYFGYRFKRQAVLTSLHKYARELRKNRASSRRVRLTMDRLGNVRLSSSEILSVDEHRVAFVGKSLNSQDRFLFHKTTNRRVYDEQLAKAMQRGLFDVIFQNERGELTEGARSNLILRIGSNYYTPPVECGLLAGVYRGWLLKSGKIAEHVLYPEDFKKADEVLVCNAVRGLMRVHVVDIHQTSGEERHAELLAAQD